MAGVCDLSTPSSRCPIIQRVDDYTYLAIGCALYIYARGMTVGKDRSGGWYTKLPGGCFIMQRYLVTYSDITGNNSVTGDIIHPCKNCPRGILLEEKDLTYGHRAVIQFELPASRKIFLHFNTQLWLSKYDGIPRIIRVNWVLMWNRCHQPFLFLKTQIGLCLSLEEAFFPAN